MDEQPIRQLTEQARTEGLKLTGEDTATATATANTATHEEGG